jgi:3-methyladenine DNA glycosylase Tag
MEEGRHALHDCFTAFSIAWPEYTADWAEERIADLDRAMIDTPAKLKSAIDNAGVNQRLQVNRVTHPFFHFSTVDTVHIFVAPRP